VTTVVELGPCTVRGTEAAPPEWVSVALDCIDDPLALLDERPVEVSGLWRDVLAVVAGGHDGALVLVVPTWWPSGRADVVAAAGRAMTPEVVVLQRSSLSGDDGAGTLVELSADFAVVRSPGTGCLVVPRDDIGPLLETATSVLIDVPAGVAPLPPAVCARLRQLGTPVSHRDHTGVRDAALAALPRPGRRPGRPRPGGGAIAVLAGAAVTAVAAGGGWAAQNLSPRPPADPATRLLVEGRVAVAVPAQWTDERVTTGPGSARVRVSAAGGSPALHITQSVGSTADVAESLRRAIGSEPVGVFVDFDPSGERGGRPAVTYVERRAGSETRWSVVTDGDLRIAIGCQSTPGLDAAVEDVCAEAVRTAHAVS
jgi:type VII secretion-associated protein (TIGR03931 family)